MAKKTTETKAAIERAAEISANKPSSEPKPVRKVRKSSSRSRPADVAFPAVSGSTKLVFPIVGIGASAGGLEALEELFRSMPGDTGLAFVVVTHQHPGHVSMLPELLAKVTDMPVVEVAGRVQVEPNRVYVAMPGCDLAILNGALLRMETESNGSPRLPIDYFLRSLAEDQNERAICIVLSGAGTDGTLGLREVKARCGMAMVELPQSAKYAGMPSSAIATGLVDHVLPPAAMPEQLLAYVRGPYLQGTAAEPDEGSAADEWTQQVIVLLRGRTGHDFSSYKLNTLRRRIERRMNVNVISDPNQYLGFLQENPYEVDVLFQELLISVTKFFRDPEAWDAIGPPLRTLIESRPADRPLRVWVPGCATGEEAYSLSIRMRECMDELQFPHSLQVFGTDLDAKAIEVARIARYPEGIRADVLPRRLAKYFAKENEIYRIRREIRDLVVFAVRNVIQDPPFTKLDVISCRNLLIYMKADLQQKLLPILHYALKPDGLLFLGPSESLGASGHLFETLDSRWKIFRRREHVDDVHSLPTIPAHAGAGDEGAIDDARSASSVKESRPPTTMERILLQQFAPPSVVVNERGDIIHAYGRIDVYLMPPLGRQPGNILAMAKEGLQLELISAIRQCASSETDVMREGLRVKVGSDFHNIKLTVAKLKEPEAVRDLLLVAFHPLPPDLPESPRKRKKKPSPRTEQLERDVQHIRDAYRGAVEESQALNEELESLNEELTMVNAQLQSNLDDYIRVNNDLRNLLESTDIATIFLDTSLNIRRYTEEAIKLVMLRPADLGRPIFELASNLKYDELTADCREVLRTLVRKECMLYTTEGAAYLMRVVPYRTTENVIDGLVLTFVDIERLIRAARETEQSGDPFNQIVQTMRHPLLMLDNQLRVTFVNDIFCGTFQTKRDETEGRVIYELGRGQWDIPELRKLLEEILTVNASLNDYEVKADFPTIGLRRMMLNARRMARTATLPAMIVLAIEDVTENRGMTAE